jgi:hypothetical protein
MDGVEPRRDSELGSHPYNERTIYTRSRSVVTPDSSAQWSQQ